MVYVRDGYSVRIYSYDVTSDSWSQLPDSIRLNASITIINGWLTTVGGGYFEHYNELFSLTGEGSDRRWRKKYPSMPTKRSETTALCTGTTLIVVGGRGGYDAVLSIVEVMDTENHQWSTAADLPQPMCLASTTVCGDHLYMLDGTDENRHDTKLVFMCLVSDLLQSCVPSKSQSAKHKRCEATVWRQVANLPVNMFHLCVLSLSTAGSWWDD